MNIVIHPRTPVWPENTLRFHLAFDKAMDTEFALGFVGLFTSTGERVHGAFVDLPNGLWTPDQKTLTVLFHPGRVKSGIGANAQLGRALRRGHGYVIRVSARMRDASGAILSRDMLFPFAAGPAVVTGFQEVRSSHAPGEGAGEVPLRIPSDRPIDWLSAQSEIIVRDSAQRKVAVTVDADALGLLLRPASAWPRGAITLAASARLEDVCGNRQDQPFESDRIGKGEETPLKMSPSRDW